MQPRCELSERIGKGAYGTVWRGKTEDGKEVAVKIIPLDNEAALEDIQKEINVLKQCNHDNIVIFLDSYQVEEDRSLYILLEYCEYGSISKLLRDHQSLPERMVAYVMKEALKGLKYLHEIHIVHRDIKGANILMNGKGQIKLADFGVSTQLQQTMKFKQHTFAGTPYWMAPEVIVNDSYDFKADIWSLGITLIELLEGNPPLIDLHPMRVLFSIPREEPPKLASPHKYSRLLIDFLRCCLVKDVTLRSSAADLLKHPFLLMKYEAQDMIRDIQEDTMGIESTNAHENNDMETVVEADGYDCKLIHQDESDTWVEVCESLGLGYISEKVDMEDTLKLPMLTSDHLNPESLLPRVAEKDDNRIAKDINDFLLHHPQSTNQPSSTVPLLNALLACKPCELDPNIQQQNHGIQSDLSLWLVSTIVHPSSDPS